MRKILGLLYLVLLASLVGCSYTTTSPALSANQVTPVNTPTTAPISSPLVGTYTTTITRQDLIPLYGPNPVLFFTAAPGSWTLVYRSDGYYTVETNNHPNGVSYVGQGPYTLTANRLTMKDGPCLELYGHKGQIGTDTWSLQGTKLVIKALQDFCPPRRLVLTSHPWLMQTSMIK